MTCSAAQTVYTYTDHFNLVNVHVFNYKQTSLKDQCMGSLIHKHSRLTCFHLFLKVGRLVSREVKTFYGNFTSVIPWYRSVDHLYTVQLLTKLYR